MYTYKATLIRVIDGDTIDAEINLGFNVIVKQRIRLYGIKTPESKSTDLSIKELGLSAKARLIELLSRKFIVETVMNKRGKIGRVLGIVYFSSNNDDNYDININDILVNEGFAEAYS